MTKEDFDAAVENAKMLEKKLIEYNSYAGEVHIDKTMELEPAEYVDLTYDALVNEYERGQKILSTRKMAIYAKEEEEAEVSVESAEVETKLREMTSETLEEAKEVAKEPVVELEKAPPKPPEIEIERPPAAPEIEIEKPPEEKPVEEERPEEAMLPEIEIEKPPEAEKPVEEKPSKAVPPALRETPSQAAERRYTQMEGQIRATLGEKPDELALKKKMLELTKQLFKEKSVNRRAEIKVQITVLKNMLVTAKKGKAVGRGKKDETYSNLYDTMLSTQQAEVAQRKDRIVDSYNKRIDEIKEKFHEDLGASEDAAKRKEIYEKFVFDVTQLVEQLPGVVKEHEDFCRKKHLAELERLRGSIKGKDKKTLGKVEGRLEEVEKNYTREFSSVKKIIGGQMDTLIEVTGTEIFKKPEEKPKEKEVKVYEIVKEINDTDEGTLLYFLHSEEPDYYRKYERKQIAKAEAIAKAKALMAKNKGLKAAEVKKYFSYEEE